MIIIAQVTGKASYEKHFEHTFSEGQEFKPDYYIDREGESWVITSQNNKTFSRHTYGLIPFWSSKRILHFESPVDGSEDPGSEHFRKKIILHPSFRRPIRETRCLVPLDYFILTNDNKELYVFFSTESRPFALAGIYDNWKERSVDCETYSGFSILTLPAGDLAKSAGIFRFPLVLLVWTYKKWLNPTSHLADITPLMNPVPDTRINGYPINPVLFANKTNSKTLLKPIGNLLRPDNTPDSSSISAHLKSFRYQRATTHPKSDQKKRTWRGQV